MKFINLERKGSFNNDNILINIADTNEYNIYNIVSPLKFHLMSIMHHAVYKLYLFCRHIRV